MIKYFSFSGVLISTEIFIKKCPNSLLSYIKFVFKIWLRYLPKMLGSAFIYGVLKNLGNGPMFSMESSQPNICMDRFWTNILFVHQFVDDLNDMCIPATWIYSAVFQLMIISPLFMAPFLKSFKFGLIFSLIAIIVFSFVKTIPKLFFDFKLYPFEVTSIDSVEDMKKTFLRFFIFTDQYINIFIVGIIVGYLLRKRPHLIDKMSKTRSATIIFTIISYSLSFLSIVWSENFKDVNQEQNQYNLVSWFILGNFMWSASIIWTVILFYKTKQGIFYSVISSRFFAALTRISISILANFSIINGLCTFMKRDNVATNHITQTEMIYLDMSLTLMASYLMFVLLEYPFIRLLEIIKNRRNVILYQNGNIKHNNQIELNMIDHQ